jgi:3-methyl-2-oxobutanoate hydroxymethyltransferase
MNAKKKITVPSIISKKSKGRKLVMVTAYDATFARLIDEAGADIVLVGDSLGMVVQGRENTLGVTLEEIIYHSRAVSRGIARAHLCGDMPFMTYKVSTEQALMSAARLVQEGHAESVKLEGGLEMADTIHRIVQAGIPVVGHVGLTPQSVHAMGGHRIQGKKGIDRVRIIEDARAVADAGAFCIVLEGIPLELAESITYEVAVPTIGIGAGPHCDGQVLVIYDLIGMNEDFAPKFLKQYAEVGRTVREAVSTFADDVRQGHFPTRAHAVSLNSTAASKTADKLTYKENDKGVTH